MSVGARILSARQQSGWSQQRLAAALGQAQTTISSWERGRTEPTRDDVARVATVLDVPLSHLELGETDREAGAEPRPGRVPVVGYVGAGAVAHLYAYGQGGGPEDHVPAPPNATADTVAVEVRGESLGRMFDEWLVYYDEVRSPVTPDLLGRLCVVGLPDGRVLVKQITPTRVEGLYTLLSNTDEAPIPNAEILWAARVTGMSPR